MERKPTEEKERPRRPRQTKRTSNPLPEESVSNGHRTDEVSQSDNNLGKAEDTLPDHKGDDLPNGDEEAQEKETDLGEPAAEAGAGNVFVMRAQKAGKEMDNDLKEAQMVLKKYGCESREIHVHVEEWLAAVYKEFEAQRERIKLVLQKKWQSKQLGGQQADAGLRQKELLRNVTKLEEFRKNGFADLVDRLKQHIKEDNDGAVEVQKDALRAEIDDFIANLREVVDSVVSIFSYRREGPNMQHQTFLQATEQNVKFLNHESKLNQKRLFTIVIIGLEKAGTHHTPPSTQNNTHTTTTSLTTT